jgi:hypothetical protein
MDDESPLQGALRQILVLLGMHTQLLGKYDARLLVLRKELASLSPDPVAAEARLRELEAHRQSDILESQGFPDTDAIVHLLKARKKPDDLDS